MSRARRLLVLPALLAVLLAAGALTAFADGPDSGQAPQANGGKQAAEAPPMTESDLTGWLAESSAALWINAVVHIGGAAVGLVLLILMWVRRDRIRAGLLPAPERVTATVAFPLPTALAILGLTFLSLVAVSSALVAIDPSLHASTLAGMVLTQGLMLAAALVVILRRRRLGAGPRRTLGGVAVGALATFLIASAVLLPTSWLDYFLLHLFEVPVTVYKPVEDVIRGSGTVTPWVIAVLSSILAPIAEESLFRGLLYPALRASIRWRHAALLAAVLTSALFALMHPHPPSWLPLFALALVLTWRFERTNSLGTVMGAHALWNIGTLLPLMVRGLS